MNTSSKLQSSSLTLVIPTFNRADLIAETIDSALKQTIPFSEIIVVDDGSTDQTFEVLSSYGDRVQTIRTANSGVQAARNTGVAAAKSAFVTLCDSDDLLEPNYVETTFPWLNAHPEIDIMYANFCTFDKVSIKKDKFSQAPEGWFSGAKMDSVFCWEVPQLYIKTVTFQPLFPSGVTFKKSFYDRLGGYDVRFNRVGAEDWEFTLRATEVGKVGICMRPLTKIRKHAGNDSGEPINLLMGEALILEHALKHHAEAALHSEKIKFSIESRRLAAFDNAYAAGNFLKAKELLLLLKIRNLDPRFQLKKLISILPHVLRNPIWKLTQQ